MSYADEVCCVVFCNVLCSAACPLLSEVVHQVSKVFYGVLSLHVLEHSIGARLYWYVKERIHSRVRQDGHHLL